MPAKSKAQLRKMYVLYEEGKITKRELEDFKRVDYKKLPEKKKKRGK